MIMLSFGLSVMTCNSADIINEGNLTPPLHGTYLCKIDVSHYYVCHEFFGLFGNQPLVVLK